MDEQIVTISGELKALGDGRVGGYLVRFGTPDQPDLTGDFFTAETDYDLDGGVGKSTVLYHHGQDATLKRRKLGRADLRIDDAGIWMEAQLKLRDEYDRAIYGMVEAGKMGLSSGTAPHLVEREYQPNGTAKITYWPLGLDASITPIPAEPRTTVMPLKSYLERAEPYVKALLPQADAGSAAAGATEDASPEPTETNSTGETTMDDETKAIIAQLAQDTAAMKAEFAKLAAQPAVNPMETEVKSQPAQVKDKPEGFATFGEQLKAIAVAGSPGGHIDRRLYATKASGMSEGIGSDGGFLVQQDFATDIFSQAFGQSEILRRCQAVPITTNANGTTIVLIDETSRANGSRWGGAQAYWRAEAATVTASAPTFREVNLNLKDLMALAYATGQLIQDAAQLESIVGQALTDEVTFKTEDSVFNGTGAGQPLGIMNSGALISVAKETGQAADTVVYQNVVKMYARVHPRFKQSAVWMINPDVFPQLALMNLAVGTGGAPVFVPAGGASGVPYNTLFGKPIIEVEYAGTVGDLGDIVLVDWRQYYLATKGGANLASSMHVRFLYDEMTYRVTYRVDGQPKFASALTPYKGSNTLGAYVALAARA